MVVLPTIKWQRRLPLLAGNSMVFRVFKKSRPGNRQRSAVCEDVERDKVEVYTRSAFFIEESQTNRVCFVFAR